MFKDVLYILLGHTPGNDSEKLNFSRKEDLQLVVISLLFTLITGLFGLFFLTIFGGISTLIALYRVFFDRTQLKS